jgi:hypothetical protein
MKKMSHWQRFWRTLLFGDSREAEQKYEQLMWALDQAINASTASTCAANEAAIEARRLREELSKIGQAQDPVLRLAQNMRASEKAMTESQISRTRNGRSENHHG